MRYFAPLAAKAAFDINDDHHCRSLLSKHLIDARGRKWRTSKDLIDRLADMMNEQSIHPLQTSDELFHIIDAALTEKEIEFLLKMGGGFHSRQGLRETTGLDAPPFDATLKSLIYKGPVAIISDKDGNKRFHMMTIYPGWFEFYMMRGVDDADHREFALRMEKMYTAAYEFGNEEVINELVRDVGPHFAVTPTAPQAQKKTRTVAVGVSLESENHVYASQTITELFESLPEDEAISVGYCLCRFEKALIGDPCRVGMPMETCISIGPAAEHLIAEGISRRITKADAIDRVKEWQDLGCVHQTGRTIPLVDFQATYPADVICNCCWDCCGVIGNYNRGYLPLTVTAHYRAIIDAEACAGCGECVEHCPVKVISMQEVAVIEDEHCIGCGQCQHRCPHGAISLEADKRVVFLPMLGRDGAHIQPPAELLAPSDDSLDELNETVDRARTLEVLEETRQKFLRPDLRKVFKKWNKKILYDFTDLGESWHFEVARGVPGPLVEGSIDKPDIHYTMSGSVFVGLSMGTIDGFKAYRKKLVKVKAPVFDLIKLQKLIG
ncbi:MAG: 4Fe-4S binding protein [Deltaproteobacteria bacterium]|nr:4Fe-4S binding protein [Deltaproteobacteria bacterium]